MRLPIPLFVFQQIAAVHSPNRPQLCLEVIDLPLQRVDAAVSVMTSRLTTIGGELGGGGLGTSAGATGRR
jgi:hypothetical protein